MPSRPSTDNYITHYTNYTTPGPDGNVMDNGIKGDAPREKYSTLKPAFIKPHGTHTAANSSFLSDGASAALLTSEAFALANGWAPKARLVDSVFVSQVRRMGWGGGEYLRL